VGLYYDHHRARKGANMNSIKLEVLEKHYAFELIRRNETFYNIVRSSRIDSNGCVYASFIAGNDHEAARMFKAFTLGYEQSVDDAMSSPKRAKISLDSGRIIEHGDLGVL
jgi:hypothetical protein